MANFLVLHGANLNMLGTREPETYGSHTLADIDRSLKAIASEQGHQLTSVQSNSEAELLEVIHRALGDVDFILINPGAFTHTSIAIRDALLAVAIPFIEVHLSNVHAREKFRQHSYLSDIATGVISGLGYKGYEMALQWAIDTQPAIKD